MQGNRNRNLTPQRDTLFKVMMKTNRYSKQLKRVRPI